MEACDFINSKIIVFYVILIPSFMIPNIIKGEDISDDSDRVGYIVYL